MHPGTRDSLACALQERGWHVVLLDVIKPPGAPRPGMHFIQGDLRSASTVRRACRGVHVVFHMASYGMSGPSQLDRAWISAINVGGTRHVIDACLEAGVRRLVYTSTYNVCFGGQPIHGGDETTPLFPLEQHVDYYSRSKSVAETMVLEADGRPLSPCGPPTPAKGCAGWTAADAEGSPGPGSASWRDGGGTLGSSWREASTPQPALRTRAGDPLDTRTTRSGRIYSPAPGRSRSRTHAGGGSSAGAAQGAGGGAPGAGQGCGGVGRLRTCALRPAAIWGAGEQRHSRRIVEGLEAGVVMFVWGGADVLVDWLHVDNLVAAQLLAAEALAAPGCPAGGQAYFISDGEPVNNFEFLRPMFEGLGYQLPRARLPTPLVLQLARLLEALHPLLRHVTRHSPLLLPAEVFKCGVTHYFCIDRARRDLGFQPQRRSVTEMAGWWREQGHGRTVRVRGRWAAAARALATAVLVLVLLAFIRAVGSWRSV